MLAVIAVLLVALPAVVAVVSKTLEATAVVLLEGSGGDGNNERKGSNERSGLRQKGDGERTM